MSLRYMRNSCQTETILSFHERKNEKRGNYPLFFGYVNGKSWGGLWKQWGEIVELPNMDCGKIPHITILHTSTHIVVLPG